MRQQQPQDQFSSLEAAELFCPRCGRATPARKHLLLVLPDGNRYEYRCSRCATPVGDASDNDAGEFARSTPGRLR
jgi:hypothetical protein